ncbi:MAG: glucosyl-3-phosphoglycerate synthase [Anaerolineae bacterium]|nr:glucosyl-3-phosphoglycerate synthase [Anaerolineae bacterium]
MSNVLGDISSLGIDLVLAQWNGPQDLTGGISTDELLQETACDVVLAARDTWLEPGSVLLALRGGPNLSLGLDVARALADDYPITLLHAASVQSNCGPLSLLLEHEPYVTRVITESSDIRESIDRELPLHKVIVIGATFRQPEASESLAGPLVNIVYDTSPTSLVLVRTARPERYIFHLPHYRVRTPVDPSTRVDRWFAESTFHSEEFDDLRHLLALKEKHGLTISVGLPALNEEATVARVIGTIKTALMDDLPLVDEIVLIDSNSTDNTRKIASAFDIPVHVHQGILAQEMGAYHGKGEALWKSLHVLKGDIIAWIDTDITNIRPHFIYGLLGPLLMHPRIQYVKGFYQRPIREGGRQQATGGGRVTELVARPLLNLFYPELSGVIQPLSGEYAGRRTLFEKLPFFTGYGVETGLLIDILEAVGLEGMAQSDLEVRVHHNQTLTDLSKMSFAILQVFIARLEEKYGAELLDKANRTMKTIVHEPGRFALEINDIADAERPPMITVSAYNLARCPTASASR